MSSASTRPANSHADENYVVTVIALFLLGSLILAALAYNYLQFSQTREQSLSDRRAYEHYSDYQQSSDKAQPTPAAKTPVSVKPAEPSMAQKLLAHPGVTAGPGFNAPGVQATGSLIVDAIDQAQSQEKSRTR